MSRLTAALEAVVLLTAGLVVALPADMACCAGLVDMHGKSCCRTALTDVRSRSCCEGGAEIAAQPDPTVPQRPLMAAPLPSTILQADGRTWMPSETAIRPPPPGCALFTLNAALLL